MFIGFIGAPGSGKTTVAAKVFAELKQNGQSDVEFIAEEARRYIAVRKSGGFPLKLEDADQAAIFHNQSFSEKVMVDAVGDYGVVISDSCAVNSLWYMTPAYRSVFMVDNAEYFRWLNRNALLFYASPIGIPSQNDALRVHNNEQSKAIDATINLMLVPDKNPWIPLNKKVLRGTIDLKVTQVIEQIYERLTR